MLYRVVRNCATCGTDPCIEGHGCRADMNNPRWTPDIDLALALLREHGAVIHTVTEDAMVDIVSPEGCPTCRVEKGAYVVIVRAK